eukprot:m.787835 g.787835  ORF g.787835 m.787835 type:complete len:586 (-) comp23309_c1_seq1:3244-5001(-)
MMTTRVCHAASNRARLLLKNAAQIVTVQGSSRGKIGTHEMNELSVLEKHNVLVGADGKISHITDEAADTLAFEFKPERVVDCSHKVIFPGFVDPHTHVVFSGDRSHEMAMKLAGASYEDVHNAGGGINHTVRHTRGSTRHELQQLALPRLDRMMQRGTTHVEIKSGYGLDVETEMKMLLVVEDLRVAHRMGITSTYLAHAVPVGMNGSTMTASVLNEHFPALATLQRQGDVSVDQVDVFCEQGFFNREEARQILCAGQGLGLAAAFHGDELNDLSCGALAAEIGARSVSHLEELSADGVEQMARAGVYGVLLPTTAHVLRLRPPPARAMIDGGVPVALATDFNPNAHCMDMPTVMNLACVLLRMTMAEAVVASTLNAAAALGLGDTLGSIEVGKQVGWQRQGIMCSCAAHLSETQFLNIPNSDDCLNRRNAYHWCAVGNCLTKHRASHILRHRGIWSCLTRRHGSMWCIKWVVQRSRMCSNTVAVCCHPQQKQACVRLQRRHGHCHRHRATLTHLHRLWAGAICLRWQQGFRLTSNCHAISTLIRQSHMRHRVLTDSTKRGNDWRYRTRFDTFRPTCTLSWAPSF